MGRRSAASPNKCTGRIAASFLRNGLLDEVGSDIEGVRIDIDEYRLRPGARDGSGCCDKSERRSNDFVARSNALCAQSQIERVRARGAPNRVGSPNVRRSLLFEQFYLLAQDEVLALENRFDCQENFVAYGCELRL